MGLKKLPFKRLQSLVGTHLSRREHQDTQEVIDDLRGVRRRGYLTKSELEKICRWKSARAINHIKRNSRDRIKRRTRNAFRSHDELEKVDHLISLHGVGIPMASSILMLTNPKRYGVIDIRVWQLLHTMRFVSGNPNGVGFSRKQWYNYLLVIRHFARKYNVGARDVERTLFKFHELYQKGRLCRN